MKRWNAVYIADGAVRRMVFEAPDEVAAKDLAQEWGVGVEGEAVDEIPQEAVLPFAFDLENTKRLLGDVSYSTIYAWHATGKLERVPGTRKLLTTRASIERAARSSRSPSSRR